MDYSPQSKRHSSATKKEAEDRGWRIEDSESAELLRGEKVVLSKWKAID
jgi:hypothetical protein